MLYISGYQHAVGILGLFGDIDWPEVYKITGPIRQTGMEKPVFEACILWDKSLFWRDLHIKPAEI